MDIAKLRIFATVARLGNFTRAAELLYLTQPTVSQQIAALEAHMKEKHTQTLLATVIPMCDGDPKIKVLTVPE